MRLLSARTTARAIVALVALIAGLTGCDPKADVTRAELVTVIERDGVAFDGTRLPDAVLDRLAAHRVVVLGETHHLREHWALVAGLMADLHARGFRQLLIEAPATASWVFDDYVTGGALLPDFEPPPFWLTRLEGIRAFNDTLPLEQRVHVLGIDANEQWYGGAAGFRDILGLMVRRLPAAGPVDAFLRSGHGTPDAEIDAIETLRASLAAERPTLIETWGPDWYEHIVEMADVERASIDIRVERQQDDNRAARAREEEIKRVADLRLAGYGHGTVINIGGHHAQKAHLMGTEQEWLGDYLVHRSGAAGGSVFIVDVASAETVLEPGAGGTPFDVRDSSPEHELFRVIAETRPGRNVFLPLDDPLFSEHRVAMNSEDVIYTPRLGEQFDAVLQYGLAHRMPDH